MLIIIRTVLFLFFMTPSVALAEGPISDIVLADFEDGILCSQCGDNLGYRTRDASFGSLIDEGAEGSAYSARFMFDSRNVDLYFQGNVRRKFLATGAEHYQERGHNALSFWIKVPENSPLLENIRFNVWTYHWRPGDMNVGGANNTSRTTDSNMHGYCDFRLRPEAAGQWVNVVLSAQAFQQARNYYHFYAGAANTDELDFFASLRQLQLRLKDPQQRPIFLQLDELRLKQLSPTVTVEQDFYEQAVQVDGGSVKVPVTLSNPTRKERRYRAFISSNLGVARKRLNMYFGLTDSLAVMRKIQVRLGADGGLGVAQLVDQEGRRIGPGHEIVIPAGGTWQGTLLHHVKPQMLGPEMNLQYNDQVFTARRDTLTSSLIIWDPDDPGQGLAGFIKTRPSNADDAAHKVPPGFPEQERPAKGWRSENIPLDQVGANIVTVLKLE